MRTLALALCLAFVVGASGARDASIRSLAQAGSCPTGQFYKPWDNSCMACDPNCASACVTKDGCTACNAGYYTSRMDPEWPNACKLCTIPNCVTCRSDIYDAWPMQCVACAAGYEPVDNRKSCAPIGGSVQGNSITRPSGSAPGYGKSRPTTGIDESGTPSGYAGPIYDKPGPVPAVASGRPAMDMVLPPGYVMPVPQPGPATKVASGTPGMNMVLPPGFVMPSTRPDVSSGTPDKIYAQPKPEPAVPVPVPVPAPVPVPVPVPAKPNPAVSPETVSQGACPTGSFVKNDGSCMVCDEFCLPGQCTDGKGCLGCQEGYFTQAEDPEWPNACVLCDLPNCAKCIDNSYTAWATFCEVCAPGYELATDRTCVVAGGNVGGESLEKEPRKEYPKEPEATGDIVLAPGACPKGQFQKEHDGTCMLCDKYCELGSCVDRAGCNQCKPGYYRSRRDDFWPYLCVQCSAVIPGCQVCEDGVFDQQPPKCLACSNGEAPADGKCVA